MGMTWKSLQEKVTCNDLSLQKPGFHNNTAQYSPVLDRTTGSKS